VLLRIGLRTIHPTVVVNDSQKMRTPLWLYQAVVAFNLRLRNGVAQWNTAHFHPEHFAREVRGAARTRDES
jgi:hypothetical protein